MMSPDLNAESAAESTIHIFMGDIEMQHLPEDIELSTEGIRFRSKSPLQQLSVVELKMEVPPAGQEKGPGDITCAGLVLDCMENDNQEMPYDVLVKFLSVPQSSQYRIRRTAASEEMKCPFREAS